MATAARKGAPRRKLAQAPPLVSVISLKHPVQPLQFGGGGGDWHAAPSAHEQGGGVRGEVEFLFEAAVPMVKHEGTRVLCYTHTHTPTPTHPHTHTSTHTHTHTHTRTHPHAHPHTRVRTHPPTHTHPQKTKPLNSCRCVGHNGKHTLINITVR